MNVSAWSIRNPVPAILLFALLTFIGIGGFKAGDDLADQAALDILAPHLDHVVQVSDAEVAAAMRTLFTDTHNVAEGAGAAALAAALQERDQLQGLHVGLALTGGNVDAPMFGNVLAD